MMYRQEPEHPAYNRFDRGLVKFRRFWEFSGGKVSSLERQPEALRAEVQALRSEQAGANSSVLCQRTHPLVMPA